MLLRPHEKMSKPTRGKSSGGFTTVEHRSGKLQVACLRGCRLVVQPMSDDFNQGSSRVESFLACRVGSGRARATRPDP